MLDLVFRNGFVVDGTGAPGFHADVGVKDGLISEIGQIGGEAREVINAEDRVVAPGFIDPQTHFDVQLLWDGAARPCLQHGVTTIVPGNCSLSLAPLREKDRPAVVGMFQKIEEMPPEAFTEGFEWTWEDFAGYRAAIEPGLSLNVAPLVGHSVLRVWVMGEDAQRRASTHEEIGAMQEVLRDCLKAGAVGLSTSVVDVDALDQPVPCRYAQSAELEALAAVLGEFGRMLQIVPEFYNVDLTVARVDQLATLSRRYGIPTTFSPVFDEARSPDDVPYILERVAEQFALGAKVWPQMQTRPIDISFSLLRPSLFFLSLPSWMKILRRPFEAKMAALQDSEVVDWMSRDAGPDGGERVLGSLIVRDGGRAPASLVGRQLRDIAMERGQNCARALITLSVEYELDIAFLSENRGHDSSERIGTFLANPLVHIGASDGGAHLATFSTYGDTGYLFSEFVRKSGQLTLENAVRKITAEPAEIWGLRGRGRLAPGLAADIVMFDPKTIARAEERAVFDVPGGGLRYVRDGIGVDAVVVNGEVAYQGGSYTGSKSGVICAL